MSIQAPACIQLRGLNEWAWRRWHLYHAAWMRTRALWDEELIHWLSLPTGPPHSHFKTLSTLFPLSRHPLLTQHLSVARDRFTNGRRFMPNHFAKSGVLFTAVHFVIIYHWWILVMLEKTRIVSSMVFFFFLSSSAVASCLFCFVVSLQDYSHIFSLYI